MAISAKLMLRQGHALVMTPQLLQAIKLLQFSHAELSAFVDSEIERNPLLERKDEEAAADPAPAPTGTDSDGEDAPYREDWPSGAAAAEPAKGEFEQAAAAAAPAADPPSPWTSSSPSMSGGGEDSGFDSLLPAEPTLREHLTSQLGLAFPDPVNRAIGQAIVDSIDEAGYLADPLVEIAARIGCATTRAERVLRLIQDFDPSGVGARDLAECLAIQLRELDRLDPAMAAMLANLPLLARRDYEALEKRCGVDAEDVVAMAAEIRGLDPKPGRRFGSGTLQTVVPDVIVSAAADGSWLVELNPEALPRVLVNQRYAAEIAAKACDSSDKSFIAGCLQDANWLTKSLDQRARTILKVASEIVRQQDAFFANGVEHLRPLNLKVIADAVRMHESTVSRVTSNKYLGSPRGLIEMKYFFTASISAKTGAEAHSAEAVRHRIRRLIDKEDVDSILSDDAIVANLQAANIEIARRTVAKYRESMRIPSSVERRRDKLASLRAGGRSLEKAATEPRIAR